MSDGTMADAMADVSYWLGRAEAELRFAEDLCELHPGQAEQWRPLVESGRRALGGLLREGRPDGAARTVESIEKELAPLADAAKAYTVHLVGHAHIDMNWMWSWPETVAVTNDTFLTVLRLMEEFPEFRFSQSQASVYRIVEEHNPALLERIARAVSEGRWEVTASHWVEGDKNLASGESLCRHLLYTRRYMQELFGLDPEDVPIDWSPDTFGHPVTVPTYLARGGVRYLYLHRPGIHVPVKPEAFWWQGPDGSRVLVRNDMRLGYNGEVTAAIARHLVRFVRETGARDCMFVYGVGNHGGGPTRVDILRAIEMARWPVFPTIRFSTAQAFYAELEKLGDRLPTLECELNTEFTGCYTTQSLIKRSNRIAENRLLDAELACALAALVAGRDCPQDRLAQAWRDTLFSHFHDILPGSCVRDSRTYTHGLFQKTVATTSQAETAALRLLASRVDTSEAAARAPEGEHCADAVSMGGGVGYGAAEGGLCQSAQSAGPGPRPFVVFNPTAWARQEVVQAVVWENAPAGARTPPAQRSFAVRMPDGTSRPAQIVDSGTYWRHDYITVAFPVEVPAFGYARCVITEAAEPGEGPSAAPAGEEAHGGAARQLGREHHCPYARWERSAEGLENALIRMELDTTTGGIRSLVEKRSGIALISPESPAPPIEYAVERPHGMSAWLIDHTGPASKPVCSRLTRPQKGPYVAQLQVELEVRQSRFTLIYEVRACDPCLYLRLRGTWLERGTPEKGVPVLRLALPLALEGARARYEVPFGAQDRDLRDGEEVPALQWAQVNGLAGGREAGVVLANDCKYGHSLDGSTLRLTLIRSAYEPDPLPEIGEHEVNLALMPFAGRLSTAEATAHARSVNHPLRVISTDAHEGDLPPEGQFLAVGPRNVVVCALKAAEDGDGFVLRLCETAGQRATARVELGDVVPGRIRLAEETDLLERPLRNGSGRCGDRWAEVAVPPRGIATLRIALAS